MRNRYLLASLVCLTLAGGCRAPAPGAVERPGLPRTEPLVRVGIVVDTTQVAVGATTAYEIALPLGQSLARAAPGEVWIFTADDQGRVVARRDDNTSLGPVDGLVRVTPDPGGAIRIDGQSYRGGALIRAAGPGRITAVNLVELESYLLGVVPAEIPSLELESVKAQAVAARTYAVGYLGRRENLGFDFFATVADQVYAGLASEDSMATRAVLETRGEIVMHDGMPILAYYHSTCGGRTAAIEEVWRRAPLPYLKSVSDQIPGTDRAYCDASNRFRWETSWTGDQLRAALRQGLAEHLRQPDLQVNRVEALETLGQTASGRTQMLRVRADGRQYDVAGDSIRWILRTPAGAILNSTLLLDFLPQPVDGSVEGLVVRGGGWGHGIGMCQFGAIGRARAGQNYRTILTTYYTRTEVVRLY